MQWDEGYIEGLTGQWLNLLGPYLSSPALAALWQFLAKEHKAKKTIYPPRQDWFNALKMTPFEKVRVVILGQDPYHGPGQAHGLSFSVPKGCAFPPSLRNIYKELGEDCSVKTPKDGDLSAWAQQGVLLLNSVLTVESGMAASHQNKGWESVTDRIIKALSDDPRPKVFILWGSYAQAKGQCIDATRHKVLKAVHPSPLSAHRGFFGSKPFSQANAFLKQTGQDIIRWDKTTEDT